MALVLVLAVLLSMLICSFPLASAAESDEVVTAQEIEDELADTGYPHRKLSLEGIPSDNNSAVKTDLSDCYLSSTNIYLKINERFRLDVMDAYSRCVNSRMKFASAHPEIAEVNSYGFVTGKSTGKAKLVITDSISGKKLTAVVHVGTEVAPTEKPTVKPTDEPTDPPEPTQPPKPTDPPETLSLSTSSATIYKGNFYQLIAKSNVNVTFKSSNTSIATVTSKGIIRGISSGSATITASTKTKSATCRITVISGNYVHISHSSVSVDRFMTVMIRSNTSGVTWRSSDTSVASVYNKNSYAMIQGNKAGTAIITAYTSSGAATCVVTVESSYPVRFAYTSPNCAAKNQAVTLVCITDTMRTGVRFEVDMGSYTRYVTATSRVKDGDTYVWKGTTSFSSAGTYDVKAYSQFDNGTSWHSCKDAETTAFVTNSNDSTTPICAKRRASDKLVDLLATFEGFCSSVYIDTFTGDPTLGYGVLVFTGEKFYNNLTKNEAYAYLVQNVNNSGYTSSVNNFLIRENIRYNQQQFDALVCFAYNNGTGPFSTDDELIDALRSCSSGGVRNFNYINKQYFINKFCQYHHAGGGCVYGLLYRRVDETEMFFYGDYHADYGNYRYPIYFTCARNSSFHT